MKKKLIISGKTENEIMEQIISNVGEDMDLMKNVLSDYERSTGLDNLKKSMSKYFEVE